ncbi:MAG: oligoendopeptidase F [Acidobacteriaceae bacterium]|jgi:oligoendopeptidase F|nr:oligoendopeptidase F [Acidobacteriaceae bacterium]
MTLFRLATTTPAPAGSATAPALGERDQIDARYTWDLTKIYPDWTAWEAAYQRLDADIAVLASLQGTLANGADALLAALTLRDRIGQAEYKVWYFASLFYDQDQRDNQANARRQQVEILFAKHAQASAWFDPELLQVPLDTVRQWMAATSALAVYRFALEDLYRQQEHVLDEKGERLLSFSSRFSASPGDEYAALSTADMKPPRVVLPSGAEVTLTYGQYQALMATNRNQADRAEAFHMFHQSFEATVNTYASIYNAVLQRDWFHAQARGYRSTLDAALHGNNIPTSVVENLIAQTKAGTDPLRRYHRVRKRVLGLDRYHLYDRSIPLVEFDRTYPYGEILEWLPESVAPLGADYQREMRTLLHSRTIDVYENLGKRSGAYSAPVYGSQPYMLMNYNDTLDAVFTLAHELGHSMHTLLAHRHQPFIYAGYTIFVAEVPSTLSEALFLDYMLERTTDEQERIVLLQHAIDGIVNTFYTQVMFADFELQAHRLVEQGKPVTAEVLNTIYLDLLKAYHGDALDYDERARLTWTRISHFYSTPYYVYQYATCFASSAELMRQLREGSDADRAAAIDRYLTLLKSGGGDHPMTLLKRAGVDLGRPETVRAVVDQLDRLVTQLEQALP